MSVICIASATPPNQSSCERNYLKIASGMSGNVTDAYADELAEAITLVRCTLCQTPITAHTIPSIARPCHQLRAAATGTRTSIWFPQHSPDFRVVRSGELLEPFQVSRLPMRELLGLDTLKVGPHPLSPPGVVAFPLRLASVPLLITPYIITQCEKLAPFLCLPRFASQVVCYQGEHKGSPSLFNALTQPQPMLQ